MLANPSESRVSNI
ncbi:hypothetical protein LINPERHAP2_LOCUS39294 [Linum perenne]